MITKEDEGVIENTLLLDFKKKCAYLCLSNELFVQILDILVHAVNMLMGLYLKSNFPCTAILKQSHVQLRRKAAASMTSCCTTRRLYHHIQVAAVHQVKEGGFRSGF
jgi:hypothetical protein